MNLHTLAGLATLTFLLTPLAALADDPGYLGVALSEVPEALSAHIDKEGGVLISNVVAGSPAEKAGLKRFDVILSANGAAVKSPEDLRRKIQEAKSGDLVKLEVIRGTSSLTLEATLAAKPVELPAVKIEAEEEKHEEVRGFLGVGPAEVPPALAYHFALKEGAGVLVGDVWKDSPAERAGIEAKDVLTAIDGKAIEGTADFLQRLSKRNAGERVKIDLIHKGEKKSVEVTLDPRPKDLPWKELWPFPGRDDPRNLKDWNQFPGPRSSHKGRIILKNPDGSERVFDLPETIWKADELLKDLEGRLGEFKDFQIPELKKSLLDSLKELEKKLQDKDDAGGRRWTHRSESHSGVARLVDGEYDITVKDQNGIRTVTVLKGGKTIADDLPLEKVDTLPPDVRDRARKAAESLKVLPAPKGEVPHLDEENKIRA